MNLKRLKDKIIGGVIGAVLVGGIATASTLITGNVYSNQFPIVFNGNKYNASMPLLNYQDRTYVPLRELATLTGSFVDFNNDTIIINNNKESKYIGKWYLEYGDDSYINIEQISEEKITCEIFFYRLVGWENFIAHKKANNVYEFSTIGDESEIELKGTLTLYEDRIVLYITETENPYLEQNYEYNFVKLK